MGLRKILLVDDDAAFHFLQRAILEQNNIHCQIDSVYDGYEALRYMEDCDGSPDLILLDINMPNWDGLDFLEACRKCGRMPGYTKIFVLTSSDMPEDKAKALSYNFVSGYLLKPLTDQALENILAHYNFEG